MAYKDLQEFLRLLDKKGELRRIAAPLDPYLEIAEVTDRVSKAVGPALFFENPKGSRFPVVTNAFGSFPRMNLALESEDLDALGRRIDDVLEMEKPEGLIDKLKMLPKLAKMAGRKLVFTGKPQQILFRHINQATAFVFTKRHFRIGNLNKPIFIHATLRADAAFRLHRSPQFPAPALWQA